MSQHFNRIREKARKVASSYLELFVYALVKIEWMLRSIVNDGTFVPCLLSFVRVASNSIVYSSKNILEDSLEIRIPLWSIVEPSV